METDELKNIWQTLAKEKLIDKELAKENIERIITQKTGKLVDKLSKKVKNDLILNISSVLFVLAATIFTTIFNSYHNHTMPVTAYIFLSLTILFFTFKSIKNYSKIKLLQLSFTTVSIKDSLKNLKQAFLKIFKEERLITYFAFFVIVILANLLLNENTDFSNFTIYSLQGFTFIISFVTIVFGPFLEKFLFKKRFSELLDDLDKSINELNPETE